MQIRYIETAEVSKMLKAAIKSIEPYANVSVRVANTYFEKMKEMKDIDVFIKNFDKVSIDSMNRIAKACRAHQGMDLLYDEPVRRFILSGEVAYRDGPFLKVPWRDCQQQQLMMFEPEEVRLGCERVNLYIGRGTTGSFTQDTDFTWIKENFVLGPDGYAERIITA